MPSCRLSRPSLRTELPPEFTLHLGPQSATQLATMARILKEMGARVESDGEGSLVAIRPVE